ncbi:hypothetical protein BGX23_008338 [Mortierella sp. AD031]|nr:hypothetical protein BGX23_008338 [Mortierella sp. AD031]
MAIPIETWYYDVPIVTRLFATGAALVALAVQTGFTNAFQLYFNYELVFYQHQYWRAITTFLYFGPLGLDFVFHMFFLVRYSRMLEEGSFYGRTMDYAWMLFLSAISLLCLSPFVAMPFLGSPLAFTLVYIWSRRNPSIPLNFLGLFVFTAPYLPWVLLGFTLLLNSHFPTGDLMGIAVGHIYYFFEDVWPKEQASGGRRYLQTPSFLTRPRGVNIPAEIQDETLAEQTNAEQSEHQQYAESEQPTTTTTPTTIPSAPGTAAGSSGTTSTTTALENGPRVEALNRANASTHNQQFDAYAKTLDDFRVKTSTGATVTMASVLIILILFIGELFDYRAVHVESSLVVDSGRKGKMSIDFDITFHKIPCYIMTLDVMDVAGEHQADVEHSIYMTQLAPRWH